MGYDYVAFGDFHFKDDLQFTDAVPMFRRLQRLADERGLEFGVKITNTFPVDVTRNELPSEEMYMSGKSLSALSLTTAYRLSKEFDGKLRISYSGGADYFNIDKIYNLGIWPVTVATTLLKPGGYNRNVQMAQKLAAQEYRPFTGVDVEGLAALPQEIRRDPHHVKPIKPLPDRKLDEEAPLLDCFIAPCSEGCPIHQDIPAYVRLTGEGKYQEALEIILDKNPLPFMTGTLCSHKCMSKCTRNFYEEPVDIRGAKLQAAKGGYEAVMKNLGRPKNDGKKVAIVGAGPAGIACAAFLARGGARVKVFDRAKEPGGTVRYVIPDFRISGEAIARDVELAKTYGAQFEGGVEIRSLKELQSQGYEAVVLAIGARKGMPIGVETEKEYNAVEFLEAAKADPDSLELGKHVAVIGTGNTAMDAARMAKRIPGVEDVTVVYRRTKRYMPADEQELKEAMEEGILFRELLAPKVQKDGLLTCRRMVLGEPDASGRQRPVETDEEVTLPADAIIASLGERVDGAAYECFGVAVSDRGLPVLDAATMETSQAGVYAIGDGAAGVADIVRAIRDARIAANAILKAEGPAPRTYACDLEAAAEKKGILIHSKEASSEKERCLECSHICENCVDVCPNRANVAVQVPGCKAPVIVHVDYMCNECGNCNSFCPYSNAPYQNKFTLFANEKDFDNSGNQGFAVLDHDAMRVKVRLAGQTAVHELKSGGCSLHEGLKQTILEIEENYRYLYI